VIQEEDLLRILKLPVLVVLDEAYIEFSDEPSRAGWVREYSNLIVLRTFSKRAGESNHPLDLEGSTMDNFDSHLPTWMQEPSNWKR
jgi:hypothetical protein